MFKTANRNVLHVKHTQYMGKLKIMGSQGFFFLRLTHSQLIPYLAILFINTVVSCISPMGSKPYYRLLRAHFNIMPSLYFNAIVLSIVFLINTCLSNYHSECRVRREFSHQEYMFVCPSNECASYLHSNGICCTATC